MTAGTKITTAARFMRLIGDMNQILLIQPRDFRRPYFLGRPHHNGHKICNGGDSHSRPTSHATVVDFPDLVARLSETGGRR